MIATGSNNINSIYGGNTLKSAVYKGNTQIWPDDCTIIGGVKWANTNLEADPNDPTGMTSRFAEDCWAYDDWFWQWDRKQALNAAQRTSPPWDWNWISSNAQWTPDNDPCPEGYRVPTRAEMESLINSECCYRLQNEVGNPTEGVFFGHNASQATADNFRGCLFLPITGAVSGTGTGWVGGQYWTSTPDGDNAFRMIFWVNSGGKNMPRIASVVQHGGLKIRPVKI